MAGGGLCEISEAPIETVSANEVTERRRKMNKQNMLVFKGDDFIYWNQHRASR